MKDSICFSNSNNSSNDANNGRNDNDDENINAERKNIAERYKISNGTFRRSRWRMDACRTYVRHGEVIDDDDVGCITDAQYKAWYQKRGGKRKG